MKKFIECASYNTAKKATPWAAVIAKVCGGYIAFESIADYQIWKSQR